MRLLILGATGMLGHKLAQVYSGRHTVFASARDMELAGRLEALKNCDTSRGLCLADAAEASIEQLYDLISFASPDWVINCVGVVKQLQASSDPLVAIPVNALFPHRLNAACRRSAARLIHISTDCVFSGNKGAPYTIDDIPDPPDFYGKTKLLGELSEAVDVPAITLRTSIVGRELKGNNGLVEWFLGQKTTVRGYARALYTGLTTLEMAVVIETAMRRHLPQGVWHVSSDAISKYDLLVLVKKQFGAPVDLVPDIGFGCDRRLDSTSFRKTTGYNPPSWDTMVARMADDSEPYEEWRR